MNESPAGDPGPVLSIWAHYDDDLIFGNPTIDTAVVRGAPVTTVFLTCSDAGRGAAYVAGREQGLKHAYEHMHGAPLTWRVGQRRIQDVPVLTWTAVEAPITLGTLGLPDGRPNGAGFPETGSQSLRQVLEETADGITPLTGGPRVSGEHLVDVIADLLERHAGGRILAHAPASAGPLAREDHSDHWSTGEFVRRAAARAGIGDDGVSWRIGYPSVGLPATHDEAVLRRKVEVFRTYAAHDPVVARDDPEETLALRGFGQWLRRSYGIDPATGTPTAL
ncbi:PIG-L family deacetylase [Microbacterium sp. BWT-B31]|uniref:PIG-L family deacetylase n=1 Tax=Microbacterium sp. BWT-B31 TaxID=3232072 RepID=UPI00352760AA